MNDSGVALVDDLQQTIRRYLAAQPLSADQISSPDEVRDGWTRLASELGLPGLAVPERFGGTGLGTAELVAVLQELGRGLYGGPFLSTAVVAVAALEAAGAGALLPEIATGNAVVGVMLTPESIRAKGVQLTGVALDVVDGQAATHFLVFAREGADLVLAELEASASGLNRSALEGIDLTRGFSRVTLEGAEARLLARGKAAEVALAAARNSYHLGLAAESCGAAARCLEMAVAYARERVQFGQTIGSFQAIKHRCADLLVKLELCRSALFHAVRLDGGTAADRATAAHMAKAVCTEAAFAIAWENIQIHGGLGYTWDHPAHLYFRRAKSNELLAGHPSQHRRWLADLLAV